jgi:hypothetical protein
MNQNLYRFLIAIAPFFLGVFTSTDAHSREASDIVIADFVVNGRDLADDGKRYQRPLGIADCEAAFYSGLDYSFEWWTVSGTTGKEYSLAFGEYENYCSALHFGIRLGSILKVIATLSNKTWAA